MHGSLFLSPSPLILLSLPAASFTGGCWLGGMTLPLRLPACLALCRLDDDGGPLLCSCSCYHTCDMIMHHVLALWATIQTPPLTPIFTLFYMVLLPLLPSQYLSPIYTCCQSGSCNISNCVLIMNSLCIPFSLYAIILISSLTIHPFRFSCTFFLSVLLFPKFALCVLALSFRAYILSSSWSC